jgi:hypothetical protein
MQLLSSTRFLQMSSEIFVGRLLSHGKVKTKNRAASKTAVDAASRLFVAVPTDEGSQRLQAAVDADLHIRFRHAVARCGFVSRRTGFLQSERAFFGQQSGRE